MPETPRPILRAAFLLIFSAIALAILPMACVEQNDDPGGGSGGNGGPDGGQQDPPTGGISFSISGDA